MYWRRLQASLPAFCTCIINYLKLLLTYIYSKTLLLLLPIPSIWFAIKNHLCFDAANINSVFKYITGNTLLLLLYIIIILLILLWLLWRICGPGQTPGHLPLYAYTEYWKYVPQLLNEFQSVRRSTCHDCQLCKITAMIDIAFVTCGSTQPCIR